MADLADLDPALQQFSPGGVDVGHDNCMPWAEPGGVSTIPMPRAIEHAEPEG
nr:hypothetical protein [Actinomycetota bacterium]